MGYTIPVEYHKLDNGLRVVLSQDHTAPLVTVAVYYHIGFRIEPRDRTGFAHLFEHMMFQGSKNLGKMEFIRLVQNNGGILNGSTRFDFTNYFEILPSNKLETALWAEADRMKGLDITQENLTNQQGVVINEVKVNVMNQPYGGFPWLDMPQYANENWYNAHNFYGELEDIEAANLNDVQDFFDTYYKPNNAVVVITGDMIPSEALRLVKKYFGDIPAGNPVELPDVSEPRQEEAKLFTKKDKLASRPALAFSYHMPDRNSPEYYAVGLLDQILLQGDDSRLYQALVQEKGLTGSIEGGINLLGNMFNYDGPILWTGYLFHDLDVASDSILQVITDVIEEVRSSEVEQTTLDRALIKKRADIYDIMEEYYGFGRADLLASFALFDDNPSLINEIEKNFVAVTPALILETAREYLRPTNQTVLIIESKDQ
ncbi:MAG: insulinase family protein [Calditrichaeota bacterium]|nr:insulinase family protein [Calditrichota bacterium]RQW08665.1 MAG: insulinase family protein [Calditrichota bacterium]